jgi:hypothetical protein
LRILIPAKAVEETGLTGFGVVLEFAGKNRACRGTRCREAGVLLWELRATGEAIAKDA